MTALLRYLMTSLSVAAKNHPYVFSIDESVTENQVLFLMYLYE
jgi:hypothetical protein